MAAKSEPAASAAPAAAAPGAPPAAAGSKSWLPVIAALLLAPLATWATVEFVLMPRLQKKLAAPVSSESAPAEAVAAAHGGKEGKDGKGAPGVNYEFTNVVVNLAGTMGTRYLKTSFLVTAVKGTDLKTMFEASKPRLTDVTLNVLSALTLADLEEPGSKNIIREKLVNAYNQALGKKVAEQVYFSDLRSSPGRRCAAALPCPTNPINRPPPIFSINPRLIGCSRRRPRPPPPNPRSCGPTDSAAPPALRPKLSRMIFGIRPSYLKRNYDGYGCSTRTSSATSQPDSRSIYGWNSG
jgi:flagellar protein FliL